MITPTTCMPATRFVALDVHRQYLVIAAVDAGQHIVLPPRRFGFEAFAEWAPAHLTSLPDRKSVLGKGVIEKKSKKPKNGEKR